jgi:anti-sigma factor RsiW
MMDKQEHISSLLADYVLDLLPVSERRRVERHAATCATCRQALQQERQPAEWVRSTLVAAGNVDHGRLAHLMPAIPRATAVRPVLRLQRQLALVGLLLVLAFGLLGLRHRHAPQGWQPPLPSAVAITATITREATSTQTRLVETAVATTSAPPTFPAPLSPTPAPQSTPDVRELVVDS